ncbi:hypothetical protein RvY_06522 [Ramazzottius varieornatus]|uniref:Uncharacterized protein n=1 Tax=Ramazzottius varieornatus TaxID=947166 RepID=A0A1D1V1U0_RAMVA|nr:hypothetical protein RvY_06522 [Ramazzottius varieornatus]
MYPFICYRTINRTRNRIALTGFIPHPPKQKLGSITNAPTRKNGCRGACRSRGQAGGQLLTLSLLTLNVAVTLSPNNATKI